MPRIEQDTKLDFKDVLIRPKRSTLRSRSEVDLERTFTFRNSGQTWSGIPIAAANMDTTGTFAVAKVLCGEFKCLVCLHKHYTEEEIAQFAKENPDCLPYIAVSAGSGEADIAKACRIMKSIPEIPFICLDVANGYSEHFISCVSHVRTLLPTKVIIAGNVVTGEMVEELLLQGADIIKVGIGPGSVCTTRRQTGVGYPQLSAVLECADAAHGLGGHIMSDGGCTCPGDFSKAFGAGSDFVMAGGTFAGHDESGGTLLQIDGTWYKQFYGMSSAVAMTKHSGGVAEYRSSEGKNVNLLYKGKVEGTVRDILGGIRSTCTYVGASRLKELSKRTTFIRVTMQLNEVYGKETKSPVVPIDAPIPEPNETSATKRQKTGGGD